MVYIPDDWIKNPVNADRLHEIAVAIFGSDCWTEEDLQEIESMKEEILKMGETTVYEKLFK